MVQLNHWFIGIFSISNIISNLLFKLGSFTSSFISNWELCCISTLERIVLYFSDEILIRNLMSIFEKVYKLIFFQFKKKAAGFNFQPLKFTIWCYWPDGFQTFEDKINWIISLFDPTFSCVTVDFSILSQHPWQSFLVYFDLLCILVKSAVIFKSLGTFIEDLNFITFLNAHQWFWYDVYFVIVWSNSDIFCLASNSWHIWIVSEPIKCSYFILIDRPNVLARHSNYIW